MARSQGCGSPSVTRTRHPDVVVEGHGRGHWRVSVRDCLGEWAITGPAYRTKLGAQP